MLTKIFHPNVSKAGEICVNTLKKDWKREFGIAHILVTVCAVYCCGHSTPQPPLFTRSDAFSFTLMPNPPSMNPLESYY